MRNEELKDVFFLEITHSIFILLYPCRCLCLGFDRQTINSRRLRRTSLHFTHIGFTDARTFNDHDNRSCLRTRYVCFVNGIKNATLSDE